MKAHLNRRDFMVKTAAATTAVMAAAPAVAARPSLAVPASPTELVVLGKTGIRCR